MMADKNSFWGNIPAKIFNVREGEQRKAFLMSAFLLVFITALMIVKPVAGSLFITRFGAKQLPFVYMLTALSAAAVSLVYSRLQRRIPLNLLMERTLAGAMVSLLLFWILIRLNVITDGILYLFYIWTGLFALVSVSQFWLAAGRLLNVRQAKRLFGMIGSGAITGGILGGYITRILVSFTGSENLMIFSMVCLMACIAIIRQLWKDQEKDLTGQNPPGISPASDQQTLKNPLALILSSRHLRILAGILGISVIVAKLVDYQFNAIAAASITSKDELTAFLGFWMSTLNFISLMVQLFITQRVVGKFGVGSSLFFLPAAVLFGAVAILFQPSLWSAIIIKMSEGGLKNSLNKSGMEILSIPIPVEIKNQTKAFIDVFVDSAATGIGGILLTVLVFGLNGTPAQVSWIIILMVGIWAFMIRRLRSEYILSFQKKITTRVPSNTVDASVRTSTQSVLARIVKALKSPDNTVVLKTLDIISDLNSDILAPALVNLLDHPDESIRLEALKKLYFYKTPSVENKAHDFLDSDSLPLKTEAMRYLFHRCGAKREMISGYLSSENYTLRGVAILSLAKEARNNRSMQEFYQPERLIETTLYAIPEITDPAQALFFKRVCIEAISTAEFPALYPYLHVFMQDKDHSVAASAIQGAALTQDQNFIPVLLGFLSRKPMLRSAAIKAFTGFGPQILDRLSNDLVNPYVDDAIRKQIPSVIASFKIQRSVDILARHLDFPDLELRHEVIRALNQLRAASDSLKFDKRGVVRRIRKEASDYMDMLLVLKVRKQNGTVNHGPDGKINGMLAAGQQLTKAIEERLDDCLERVFRLLGLRYPPVDMYNAYKGVKSPHHEMRMNAMEFLDNVLEMNLKSVVIPLLESGSSLFEVENSHNNEVMPDEFEACVSILQGQDDFLKEKVLNFLSFVRDRRYTPHVLPLLGHPNRTLRNMAAYFLDQTGPFPFPSRYTKKASGGQMPH